MLQIGITGGIGTGKSIVSRVFQLLGIPVYDSDAAAKLLMASDEALKQELISAFGPDTYTAAGQLNRAHLAQRAFHDPTQLARLNALVHPAVARHYQAWAEAQQGVPYVLKEAALLFESGSAASLDKVITVYAPLELRISRLGLRDPHRTLTDIMAIIGKQLPEEEHQQRADYVIRNDDQELVIPQVLTLHEAFLRLKTED